MLSIFYNMLEECVEVSMNDLTCVWGILTNTCKILGEFWKGVKTRSYFQLGEV